MVMRAYYKRVEWDEHHGAPHQRELGYGPQRGNRHREPFARLDHDPKSRGEGLPICSNLRGILPKQVIVHGGQMATHGVDPGVVMLQVGNGSVDDHGAQAVATPILAERLCLWLSNATEILDHVLVVKCLECKLDAPPSGSRCDGELAMLSVNAFDDAEVGIMAGPAISKRLSRHG